MKAFGSLTNRLEEGLQFTDKIDVGTGVTEMCFSDRHAWEVVKVIDDKHLLIRRCKATRIDKNGMSDDQEYKYELEPYKQYPAGVNVFGKPYKAGDNNYMLVKTKKTGWRLRNKDGRFSINKFTVGKKEEYFDFSF